jgi:hypothetical protein
VEQTIVAKARKRVTHLSPEARSARDAEVVKMLETKDVKEVARLTGLTTSRILQIRNEQGSGRTRLMLALQEAADERGRVSRPLSEIAPPLGLDMHNATHLVRHSLKRAGLVHFIEVKGSNGDQQNFKELTLTKKGLAFVGAAGSKGSAKAMAETKPFVAQAVADAALDEAEHTNGVHTAKPKPVALEPDSDDIDVQAQPVIEPLVVVHRDTHAASDEVVDITAKLPDQHRYYDDPLTDFPLLRKLRERKAQLTAAAKTLESHGLVEEALSALDAAEPHNELEAEILRFIERQEES